MIFIVFLVFFEMRLIKALSLKVTWFSNRPTYRNCYPSKFLFIKFLSFELQPQLFETDPSQLQPHAQGVNFSPHYSYWVRRFFIDNLSTYFVNNLSVFFLSSHWVRRFFIDWFGWFSSSVPHWVRRFFTKLPINMTIRLTGLTSKREGNCNAMVTWRLREGYVIPSLCQ